MEPIQLGRQQELSLLESLPKDVQKLIIKELPFYAQTALGGSSQALRDAVRNYREAEHLLEFHQISEFVKGDPKLSRSARIHGLLPPNEKLSERVLSHIWGLTYRSKEDPRRFTHFVREKHGGKHLSQVALDDGALEAHQRLLFLQGKRSRRGLASELLLEAKRAGGCSVETLEFYRKQGAFDKLTETGQANLFRSIIRHGDNEVLEWALASKDPTFSLKSEDPIYKEGGYQNHPLRVAIQTGDIEKVQLILDAGRNGAEGDAKVLSQDLKLAKKQSAGINLAVAKAGWHQSPFQGRFWNAA